MQSFVLFLIRSYFRVAGLLWPGLAARQALWLFQTPLQRRPASPQDQEVLRSAETFRVNGPQGSLCVYRWPGIEASAPKVLLVHGWESRAGRLAKWVEPLRRSGFEVVALDLPAHGESDGRRTHPPEATSAVGVVAAEAGPFYGLVGHSFGAVCCAVAVTGEELTGEPPLPVEKLVLVAGSDRLSDVLHRYAETVGLNERVLRGLHDAIAALSGRPVEAFSVSAGMASCPVPTLVVHDPEDGEVPYADAEAVASAAPAGVLMTTEGLGHHRIIRDPGVIERAVGFLSS